LQAGMLRITKVFAKRFHTQANIDAVASHPRNRRGIISFVADQDTYRRGSATDGTSPCFFIDCCNR